MEAMSGLTQPTSKLDKMMNWLSPTIVAACVLTVFQASEAQIVRLLPGGGVNVRAPFVRVHVDGAGNTHVRAPLVDIFAPGRGVPQHQNSGRWQSRRRLQQQGPDPRSNIAPGNRHGVSRARLVAPNTKKSGVSAPPGNVEELPRGRRTPARSQDSTTDFYRGGNRNSSGKVQERTGHDNHDQARSTAPPPRVIRHSRLEGTHSVLVRDKDAKNKPSDNKK